MDYDYRQACAVLERMETEFDVNSVACSGVSLWPLIRLMLWDDLLVAKSVSRMTSFIRRPLAIRLYEYYISMRNSRTRVQSADISNHCEVVFFSRFEDHFGQMGNKVFNPRLDPMISVVQDRFNVVKIESTRGADSCAQNRYVSTLFVDPLNEYYASNPGSVFHEDCRIDEIDSLTDYLKSAGFPDVTVGGRLKQQFMKLRRYRDGFGIILDKLRPSMLVMSCYYSVESMGLLWACRERNIATIEMQHGVQVVHGMYIGFHSVPGDGYSLMPDYFWMWGKKSADTLSESMNAPIRHHIPVAGGHAWLSQWFSDGSISDRDRERHGVYFSRLGTFKKVILFTHQHIENPIPGHLVEAIRRSPDSWLWLVRRHPHRRITSETIETYLIERGAKNIEVAISSEMHLYTLLDQVDHHVTCWSAVCYEAECFGVPTTFVDTRAGELYGPFDNDDSLGLAMTADELLSRIEQTSKVTGAGIETEHIIHNKRQIADTFERLYTGI